MTTSQVTARRTALYSGVVCQIVATPGGKDEVLDVITAGARQSSLVNPGDTVVITASTAAAVLTGATNLLELRRL